MGIKLVEVVWKMITIIIENLRDNSVEFQYVLHDLQSNWGKGTASLEENLLKQLVAIQE